ncbi:Glutamyl-tRNA(Gln) amidotransferase subunit B, mitochondrial [Pseudolycoriella hygida]|uniref:Glutamyl-tRNA(Gln) amidotransferase subunit B, mitochondrial n=1 Tax=Pseudolycoriella hygida TaxID=35572 RepID=A0A9Q0MZR7_9DIPT|nr:Glutamyl-tRNA(Gln) amidotransferase subunit B, mitochondrial [Pseudolycoriella hygida]
MYMKLIQRIVNFRLYRNFATVISAPKKSKWDSVVGLEIHAQIASNSKLFSGAAINFGAPPNVCVSDFDAALPGTLPVLNEQCVTSGIQVALALACTIHEVSMFDRKHYFYADLPAGYQITQQRAPLASNGKLGFYVDVPGAKKPYQKASKLHQLQLEQDSGKSLHDPYEKRSLIDLNRAGVPLMELVFEPDLTNGEEAAALVKELILILLALDACSCRMDKGALRVDANISINKPGEPLGVRTEVKNIGSVRGVANAVDYEIKRQIDIKERGGQIQNETRSWDAITNKTVAMRDKEVLQDYRFMPEPNLPPLRLNVADDQTSALINVERLRKTLPELPEQLRNNLVTQYALRLETAIILVNQSGLLQIFIKALEKHPSIPPMKVANFLINHKISDANLVDLIAMLNNGTINYYLSTLLLQEMFDNPSENPKDIAHKKDLLQIMDPVAVEAICKDVLGKNGDIVRKSDVKLSAPIFTHFNSMAVTKLGSTTAVLVKKFSPGNASR